MIKPKLQTRKFHREFFSRRHKGVPDVQTIKGPYPHSFFCGFLLKRERKKTMDGNQAVQIAEERRLPGLYDKSFEHDNCGVGAVVNIKGIKTHQTVENALKIVENLEHWGGKHAEAKTGGGVGILIQISLRFFKKAA